MYRKIFYIDFYHVNCQHGKFHDYITRKNFGALKHRVFDANPYKIILDEIDEHETYIWGNLIKARYQDVDPKYNFSTFKSAALNLADVEGVAHAAIFLYIKNKQILLIQNSMYGPNPKQFCQYFSQFSNTGPLNLDFVLSRQGFEELNKLDYISKIEVSIKGLDKGFIFKSDKNDAKGLINKMKELGGNTIDFSISKGKRSNGLSLNTTKTFLRDIYRVVNSNLEDEKELEQSKIQVKGSSGEEDLHFIDLIVKRMKKQIVLEYLNPDRLNTGFNTDTLYTHLKAAARDSGPELDSLYE